MILVSFVLFLQSSFLSKVNFKKNHRMGRDYLENTSACQKDEIFSNNSTDLTNFFVLKTLQHQAFQKFLYFIFFPLVLSNSVFPNESCGI